MSIFPDPLDPAEEEPDASGWMAYIPPAWAGPPVDELPAAIALDLVLGESSSAAVFLSQARAFSTGIALRLGVRLREESFDRDLPIELGGGCGGESTRGGLRWGVEFADGRRATNVDADPWAEHAEGEPGRAVLLPGGGYGSASSVDTDFWLWPLPPPGPLRIGFDWERESIAETVHELDGAAWLAAAARARPLWSDL